MNPTSEGGCVSSAPQASGAGRASAPKRTSVAAAQAMIACAAAAACAVAIARAQDSGPANTLMELRRQFAGCLAKTPLGPSGSQVTITFMAKRDGTIFGKPRITFSRLEGDADARRGFVDDAERAVDACLPLKVTPALGGAIAGRPFVITLGRPKMERGV
jgi:hypothetical protein